MSDKSYNGWTNYETWVVNLWLANDEGLYIEATDRATNADGDVYDLAQDFKSWVCDDLAPDLGASFAADLLNAALSEVDWNEIATSWLEDVAEDA